MFPSRFEAPPAARTRHAWRFAARSVFALCLMLLSAHYGGAQSLEPGGPADMGSVAVGGSSLNYTFTFSATVPTTIMSVITVEEGAQNQDFILTAGATQTCTGTIMPPHSCNINVTFTPRKIGFRRGAILIIDNTGTVVNTQFLFGVGLAPQFSFAPVTSTIINTLPGVSPTSFKPSSAVYDGAGDLYFYDYQNGRLLLMDTSSNITSIGSFTGNTHSSLAINGAGTLFLTLPTQGAVEVIKPGVSTSLLTVPGMTLTAPDGIAIDGAGFIYIADAQKNDIVRVAPDSSASSVIPTTGLTLSSPFGLAVNNDYLYIADSGNGRIVEISIATGVATALTSTNALNQPYGISPDPSETLIVADTGGSNIVSVTPTGTVTPLVADSGSTIAAMPLSVMVAPTGDVLSSDGTLGLVFISRNQGSLTFPTPTKVGTLDGTDGYETLTVINSGNQVIQFSAGAPTISDTDYAPGPTNTCPVQQTASTPLAIAASCTYTFGFTPSVIGPDDAVASIRGTSPATGVAVTGIADLNGTGLAPVTTFSVTTNPASTTPGTPVSFTVTALEGTTALTTFTGTVTFTMTDSSGNFLGGNSYTFTSADAGSHTFPATLGAQFNTPGKYTITAKYSTISGTSNIVTVLYASSTSLSSSRNPVPTGGQTTLTATVSGSGTGTTPTGTVTFYDGTTAVGTCTLVGGKCSYTPTLPVGPNQSLTAVYAGDGNFSPSTSSALSETVNGYNSTSTLTSSVNPSAVGQTIILTATVVPTAGQTNPPTLTGSVTFYDGSTALATVTLTNGVASCNASFTTPGNHSLTVQYSGDTNYAASTSAALTQVVSASYTATLVFTSSVNPAAPGQSFTLTATVAPTAGQTNPPTPTGKMQFYNGTTLNTTVMLSGGVATFTTAYLTLGSYPLTAVYSGDGNYAGSSATLTEVIARVTASQTTLAAATNPVTLNTSVNLTATVGPAPGKTGTPSGNVSFYDGTTLLGTATLSGGSAILPATFTTTGAHSLTAVYAGDTNFSTSTSSAYIETVNGYTAAASLASSVNPSTVGQQTVLTATVAATAGQANPPTLMGSVSFYDGSSLLGSASVSGGTASLPATFATAGNHSLTAVYSGDGNYGTATSGILVQVVTAPLSAATVSLTSGQNPAYDRSAIVFTATVSPAVAGTTVPTGMVTFLTGTSPIGTSALVNGVATLSYAFVPLGTFPITAVYSGDANYATAASPVVNEVIEDFTFTLATPASGSVTVAGGSPATYTFTVTPIGGTVFPAAVNFTLTGFPSSATYTFSPATLAAGASSTTITLTITPAAIASLERDRALPLRSRPGFAPVVLAFVVLPLAWPFGKRRRPTALLLWLVLLVSALGLTGCLSDPQSGYYGTTPATYPLTVTATSANLSRSATVSLTRQ